MISCLDLEGVLTPEIWIQVAERSGIPDLRLTTRDISDYDVLMRRRLKILDDHGLKLGDIRDVIETISPLPGAVEFLGWLRTRSQVIILSDTYEEFALPLMAKLGYPTLFCNSLKVDPEGRIAGYHLRQSDGKRKAVAALRGLNFKVVAAGDSYNDVTMLAEADAGILFRPPDSVIREFPQYPVTQTYEELKREFTRHLP
jgi:phosphoserine/homoserine phosphotransferase